MVSSRQEQNGFSRDFPGYLEFDVWIDSYKRSLPSRPSCPGSALYLCYRRCPSSPGLGPQPPRQVLLLSDGYCVDGRFGHRHRGRVHLRVANIRGRVLLCDILDAGAPHRSGHTRPLQRARRDQVCHRIGGWVINRTTRRPPRGRIVEIFFEIGQSAPCWSQSRSQWWAIQDRRCRWQRLRARTWSYAADGSCTVCGFQYFQTLAAGGGLHSCNPPQQQQQQPLDRDSGVQPPGT